MKRALEESKKNYMFRCLEGGTVLIMRAPLVKKPKHKEPSERHERGKMWSVELVGSWTHHPWTVFLGGRWFAKGGWGTIMLHSFVNSQMPPVSYRGIKGRE